MARHLTNLEIRELSDALRTVFSSRNRLDAFLFFRLNRAYADFQQPEDALPDVIYHMVKDASDLLWWPDLVREARNFLPADDALASFAARFGMAPEFVSPTPAGMTQLSGSALQQKIRAIDSTFDIAVWRARLGDIEGRVCRIEYPAKVPRATGSLIGPNAVITNYHVIEGITSPADVRLRFDYKIDLNGISVGNGVDYALADDWLYDQSPYSPEDNKVHPNDPSLNQLDYAILRVNGAPGNDPIGGNKAAADPNATSRGWLTPVWDYDFLQNRALYIVEHPDGKPLKVAIDSDAVVGMNANRTRVRYTTETEPGSSGAPCFSAAWEWVAIHHSGDPKFLTGAKPEFNQGIPLAAIRALLQNRDKLGVFGQMI
jgi:V8-like Glu-specific endopeptidase